MTHPTMPVSMPRYVGVGSPGDAVNPVLIVRQSINTRTRVVSAQAFFSVYSISLDESSRI